VPVVLMCINEGSGPGDILASKVNKQTASSGE